MVRAAKRHLFELEGRQAQRLRLLLEVLVALDQPSPIQAVRATRDADTAPLS